MWRYSMFAFICYVSIHLEISATVVRSAPEELPIRIRTTSFRDCGIGQEHWHGASDCRRLTSQTESLGLLGTGAKQLTVVIRSSGRREV
jgi:hypothetical protein